MKIDLKKLEPTFSRWSESKFPFSAVIFYLRFCTCLKYGFLSLVVCK